MNKRIFSLDKKYTYQIKVHGDVISDASGWDNVVFSFLDVGGDNQIFTTLICYFDQAALHGFLRSLYAKGMSLVLVKNIEHI